MLSSPVFAVATVYLATQFALTLSAPAPAQSSLDLYDILDPERLFTRLLDSVGLTYEQRQPRKRDEPRSDDTDTNEHQDVYPNELFLRLLESVGFKYGHRQPRTHEEYNRPNVGRPSAEMAMQEMCQLPVRKGVCRALIPRWSFDPSQGACIEFMYGGCGGNGNNFDSQDECERACKK